MSAAQDREASLIYHVQHYLPEACDEELKHRVTLLKARDWCAAQRGRTDCPFALDLAIAGHDIAGQFVFAENESVSRLSLASDLCRRLAGAALAADALSATDDPGEYPTISIQVNAPNAGASCQ